MSMPAELIFAIFLVAIVLWMDVKATMLVLRDLLSEPSQRLIQLLMVWLLPVIGAIIVFAVHRPAEKHSGKYSEPPDPGDDFGYPRQSSRSRSNDGVDDD
jgi:hypothetical protein